MKLYAGIGSRETPEAVCSVMSVMAGTLGRLGWVLRSGHAPGADIAFERGARFKQIFLPWEGFNGASRGQFGHQVVPMDPAIERAARSHHPNWAACSSAARLLHMRNVCQILGPDMHTPVQMVVCWTKGGKLVGGTAQALRIARAHGIPIFNLAIDSSGPALMEFLNELEPVG